MLRLCRSVVSRLAHTQSRISATYARSMSTYGEPSKPESPGGRDGIIDDTENQAVGKQFEEAAALSSGKRRFETGPIIGVLIV